MWGGFNPLHIPESVQRPVGELLPGCDLSRVIPLCRENPPYRFADTGKMVRGKTPLNPPVEKSMPASKFRLSENETF
jgi:hypothetical protein